MNKSANDNGTTGGALDIREGDVYRNETDRELHHPGEKEPADPGELTNPDAIKASLRYGRDTIVNSTDIDPEEDNYAPGIREQD
jgi:hypothetical protein